MSNSPTVDCLSLKQTINNLILNKQYITITINNINCYQYLLYKSIYVIFGYKQIQSKQFGI